MVVRVRRVGICGTDMHIYAGKHPFLEYPRVMGHEPSGEVADATGSTRLRTGRPVYVTPIWLAVAATPVSAALNAHRGTLADLPELLPHWIDTASSVAEVFHAADDWAAIEARFVSETRFVVCNTGDSGWRLGGESSFPVRLLRLLHARFVATAEPLVLLLCELVSGNGRALCSLLVELAGAHGHEPSFIEWLRHRCMWANSLVDRIVSEALEPVGAVAEPYALWAIAAAPGVEAPCVHPDIQIVADLLPYERLKLFILNLGHTVLAERWMTGRRTPDLTVAEALADRDLRAGLDEVYSGEVLPVFAALGIAAQATGYRDTVIERFANPFPRHRLANIAQNHGSKKQRRIAPLLALAAAAGLSQATHLAAIMASDVE